MIQHEIRPETASTKSTETDNGNSHLVSNINGKTQDPICYYAGYRWAGFRSTLTPRDHLLAEKGFDCSSQSIQEVPGPVTGARVLHREPIRYCFKTKTGVAGESGQNATGVTEKAVMIVIGVEEGDLEASKVEKFGEFKHGVEVALNREREDENMRRG